MPQTAKRMAVDPDFAFAKGAGVEERVGWVLRKEAGKKQGPEQGWVE